MLITGSYRNKHVVLSPDNKYGYIVIPKNASQWTVKYLTGGWGWMSDRPPWDWSPTNQNYYDTKIHEDIKFIVILRDPLDRWCSGMTQLLWSINEDYDWSIFINREKPRGFFNKLQFDEHTDLQCSFLFNIDTSQCLFFYVDEFYEKNFRTFCHKTFIGQYNSNKLTKNSSGDIKRRNELKKFLRSHFDDPKYMDLIYDFYRKDYELINSVEFYGKKSS